MLRSIQDLELFTIDAGASTIGYIKDFFFDEQSWVIRYLVVDVGVWLTNRKVLISPVAIADPDWEGRSFPVAITKEQIKGSPHIDTYQPVSRRDELRCLEYYGHPAYWGGDGSSNAADFYLGGCKAVNQDRVFGSDGEVGRVRGQLVDDTCWTIRYLIVSGLNGSSGESRLIAPDWIKAVNWTDGRIAIDLPTRAVRDAPCYDAALPLRRDQEIGLYAHYGRIGYWAQ